MIEWREGSIGLALNAMSTASRKLSRWILRVCKWDDEGIWVDEDVWND